MLGGLDPFGAAGRVARSATIPGPHTCTVHHMDQLMSSAGIDPVMAFAEAGRRCSRPLCSRVADVVLMFEYAASHVVLDWSPADHDPNLLELCLDHAETFRPPRGWTVDDARAVVAAIGDYDSL